MEQYIFFLLETRARAIIALVLSLSPATSMDKTDMANVKENNLLLQKSSLSLSSGGTLSLLSLLLVPHQR